MTAEETDGIQVPEDGQEETSQVRKLWTCFPFGFYMQRELHLEI